MIDNGVPSGRRYDIKHRKLRIPAVDVGLRTKFPPKSNDSSGG